MGYWMWKKVAEGQDVMTMYKVCNLSAVTQSLLSPSEQQ